MQADEEIILGCYYELVEAVILNACFEDYFLFINGNNISSTKAVKVDERYNVVYKFADSEIIDLFCQSSYELDKCKITQSIRERNQENYEKAVCKLKLLGS